MRFIYLFLLLIMAFVCSRVPRGTTSNSISILTIGNIPQSTINTLSSEISSFYQTPVNQLPPLTLPPTITPRAGKYPGTDILDLLKQTYPHLRGKIIAITSLDIATERDYNGVTYPNWGIMGLSYLNSSPAVVSTYRLNSLPSLVKVCLHELGHTYGLKHCPTPTCLMHEGGRKANSQISWEHKAFCPHCKSLL